jgi:c-di-GMP-binding flagellar brake protein YcgR
MRDEIQNGEPKEPQKYDFESMNLLVGTRLQLFTHRQIKPGQHFSTLIGYVKDEYLLVKMPFENGSYTTLHDGEKITIRVFSGTSICSFACTVIRTLFHPFFYVHLTFPRIIESKSLRVSMRVKVNLPAQIMTPDASGNAAATDVVISNLSVTGALIESRQELGSIEQVVGLSFTPLVQQGDREVRIDTKLAIRNATLRKASSIEQQDTHVYGVQFIDLDPIHRMLLQNMTYEALLADRQNIV